MPSAQVVYLTFLGGQSWLPDVKKFQDLAGIILAGLTDVLHSDAASYGLRSQISRFGNRP